ISNCSRTVKGKCSVMFIDLRAGICSDQLQFILSFSEIVHLKVLNIQFIDCQITDKKVANLLLNSGVYTTVKYVPFFNLYLLFALNFHWEHNRS
ncbi:transcriptional activator FlhD, partial [Trichinella spiralis]|uniref:transcriptional activator FlhD n=1 Tax=Trichinella spiralis TaxID=6334 RepID=UPI0001EFDB03